MCPTRSTSSLVFDSRHDISASSPVENLGGDTVRVGRAGVAFDGVQNCRVSVSSTRSHVVTARSVAVAAAYESGSIVAVGTVTPSVTTETAIVVTVTLTIAHAGVLSGIADTGAPPERSAGNASQHLTLRLDWALGDVVYDEGFG